MSTIFLRFTDRAAFVAAMSEGFADNGETGEPLPEGIKTMSIIGSITRETVTVDADGVEQTTVEKLDGFHVNVQLADDVESLPEDLQQYQVFPNDPVRIFGGAPIIMPATQSLYSDPDPVLDDVPPEVQE